MLAGLGHHPLVGGDDEQGRVDAAHAGKHVLDEVDVAGHVDDAHRLAVWQRQPGEAQVDGHLPRLFLGQPVGVDAGQRQHQGRLAVVHVACGADDFHLYTTLLRRRALSSNSSKASAAAKTRSISSAKAKA